MPVEIYPRVTLGGKEYWRTETLIPVDYDPERGVFIFVGTPQGGLAALGAFAKGDPGKHTLIDSAIDFTELAHDDPTPASAGFTVTTPGSETVSQVVKLALALHRGAPGAPATNAIDLSTIAGIAAAGKIIVVNAAANGFDFAAPKVGGMHWPATITSAPAGTTAGFTLSTITVAANTYGFDWRPRINAGANIIGSSSDVRVDIIARLGADNGPVVGRGSGVAGVSDKLVLISGPDAGAADSVNRVAANAAATIYLRAEKQGGSGTYQTAVGTERFSVEAIPVP